MSGGGISDGSVVLADHCKQVADSATSAIQFLAGVRFRAPEQRLALEHELRHVASRAEILRRNITRPANIALFGPNQSGKSYVAAALSRRGMAPPKILLGDEKVEFLTTTSLAAAAKSSACVTRFSLRRAPGAVAGLPVSVQLLSQADVIRIVANAYLEDIDPGAVDAIGPDRVRTLIAGLRTAATGARAQSGMTAQDVELIWQYFDRYFAEHPVVRGVADYFWTEAATLVPRLTAAQRAELFAVFWGEIPQLTSLCARLLGGLERLGNPAWAYCEKAALTAGANSITEVETMMQGLEDEAAPRLKIGTVEGYRGDIHRPLLAALTSELHLTLDEAPQGFYQAADLLDFPGALPRNRFTDPESLLADPTNRAWLFRRGKAAYLFQRYSGENQLTSLILCLEDGPQTARTLPGLVKEWIDLTHGETAEERAKLPCSLFVALTKFDMEIKDQLAQRDDDPEHWNQRLRGVFNDFLCREHRWADSWTPAKAFNNSFWLRQPGFVDQDVMQYDSSGREIGVADRARMTKLRSRYLASGQAGRHFSDPSRAWDEAMRLNDGGAGYLATQLRAVCDPDVRRRQVAEQLGGLARELHQILEPFHSASDQQQRPAAVQAAAQPVAVTADAVAAPVARAATPATAQPPATVAPPTPSTPAGTSVGPAQVVARQSDPPAPVSRPAAVVAPPPVVSPSGAPPQSPARTSVTPPSDPPRSNPPASVAPPPGAPAGAIGGGLPSASTGGTPAAAPARSPVPDTPAAVMTSVADGAPKTASSVAPPASRAMSAGVSSGVATDTPTGGMGKMVAIGAVALVTVGVVVAFATGMFSSTPDTPTAPPTTIATGSGTAGAPAPIRPPGTQPPAALTSGTPTQGTPTQGAPTQGAAPPVTGAATLPAAPRQPPQGTVGAGNNAGQTAAVIPLPAPQQAPVRPATASCGPIQGPERLSALPQGVSLTPADLVCVAKRWIDAGRPGDAVLLLTRAIQDSSKRVYGPASLELARLYDPQRETPGWPSSAGYALEKYQDAINDTAFPEIQEQARTDRDKLQKAQ